MQIELNKERIQAIATIRNLLYMWDFKTIAKENLEGYEQGLIIELINYCEKL
ncbi:hypothetical protein D3C76_222290 [compost metagenome]